MKLVKTWEDWSGGAFHPLDDGSNGYIGPLTAGKASWFGGQGWLRWAPKLNESQYVVGGTIDFAHGIVVDNPVSGKNLYLWEQDGEAVYKVAVKWSADNLSWTDYSSKAYTGQTLGRPAYYKGNAFFCGYDDTADPINEIVTSLDAVIGSDTITPGDPNSGGGHLALIGHQLCKFNPASGVSILASGAAARTGTWGSYFNVGDPSTTALGMYGLQGLAFVLRQDGLWSFNTRGEDATLYNVDYVADSGGPIPGNAITYWKDSLVYIHNGSVYLYNGGAAIDIGPSNGNGFYHNPRGTGVAFDQLFFSSQLNPISVRGVGDYLYAIFEIQEGGNSSGYLCVAHPGPDGFAWFPVGVLGNAGGGLLLPVMNIAGNGDLHHLYVHDPTDNILKYYPISGAGNPLLPFNTSTGYQRGTSVETTAEVYMSELLLDGPQNGELRVWVTGLNGENVSNDSLRDYLQFRAVINGQAITDIGKVIYDNKVHTIPITAGQPIRTLIVGVHGTTGGSRAATFEQPTIRRMELWTE